MTKISVIIPVFNGEKTINRCLESLLNQNFLESDYEIIVIDDWSTDNTVNIINQIKNRSNIVSYYSQENIWASKARNFGVKLSNYEYVAFIYADVYVDKNWLKNIAKAFSNPEVNACWWVIDNYNNSFFSNINHIVEFSEFYEQKHKIIKTIPSLNLVYKKEVFDKLWWFNEALSVWEDADLNFRLTKLWFKLHYYPDIIVYHDTSSNYKGYIKKQYNFWFKAFDYRRRKSDSNYILTLNKYLFLLLIPFYVLRNILMYFTRKHFYKHPINSILWLPFLLMHKISFWYWAWKFVFLNK